MAEFANSIDEQYLAGRCLGDCCGQCENPAGEIGETQEVGLLASLGGEDPGTCRGGNGYLADAGGGVPTAEPGADHPLAGPDQGCSLLIVQAAVAAERARIARDLHDAVGKSLLGIELAAASLARPGALRRWPGDKRLRELSELARRAARESRHAINDLRDDTLSDAIAKVAAAWGIVAGARVACFAPPVGDTPDDIRRELVRILAEALRNVEEHAHASRVRVSLRTMTGRLQLTVADNGVGFRAPAGPWEPRPGARTGLTGIAERARRLGGFLTVKSRPSRGTRLTVHVPLASHTAPHVAAAASAPLARVVIADANPLLRLGLRAALEQAPDVEVVGEAANGRQLTEYVRHERPDVVLLDVRLPMPGGLAAIREIRRSTQVIMLSFPGDAGLVTQAVNAGAHADLVHSEFEPGALRNLVVGTVRHSSRRSLHSTASQQRFQPGGGHAQAHAGCDLTPREREVMELIAKGLSNRQIAARLVITEKTVKNHIWSIYQRIGVCERSQAVSRWRQL